MNSKATPLNRSKPAAPAPPPHPAENATGVELGTDGPPPPRKVNARDEHAHIYEQVCRLGLPGSGDPTWLVWKSAPKTFCAKVRKWAKASGMKLAAYTDVTGRAIVQRLPDDAAEPDAGGDGDEGESGDQDGA